MSREGREANVSRGVVPSSSSSSAWYRSVGHEPGVESAWKQSSNQRDWVGYGMEALWLLLDWCCCIWEAIDRLVACLSSPHYSLIISYSVSGCAAPSFRRHTLPLQQREQTVHRDVGRGPGRNGVSMRCTIDSAACSPLGSVSVLLRIASFHSAL